MWLLLFQIFPYQAPLSDLGPNLSIVSLLPFLQVNWTFGLKFVTWGVSMHINLENIIYLIWTTCPCICIHFNNSWKKFSNYGLQIIHPHYFNSNSLLIKINFWKIKKSKINFKMTYLPNCSINRNYKDTCFLKNYHKSKCSHF